MPLYWVLLLPKFVVLVLQIILQVLQPIILIRELLWPRSPTLVWIIRTKAFLVAKLRKFDVTTTYGTEGFPLRGVILRSNSLFKAPWRIGLLHVSQVLLEVGDWLRRLHCDVKLLNVYVVVDHIDSLLVNIREVFRFLDRWWILFVDLKGLRGSWRWRSLVKPILRRLKGFHSCPIGEMEDVEIFSLRLTVIPANFTPVSRLVIPRKPSHPGIVPFRCVHVQWYASVLYPLHPTHRWSFPHSQICPRFLGTKCLLLLVPSMLNYLFNLQDASTIQICARAIIIMLNWWHILIRLLLK